MQWPDAVRSLGKFCNDELTFKDGLEEDDRADWSSSWELAPPAADLGEPAPMVAFLQRISENFRLKLCIWLLI